MIWLGLPIGIVIMLYAYGLALLQIKVHSKVKKNPISSLGQRDTTVNTCLVIVLVSCRGELAPELM